MTRLKISAALAGASLLALTGGALAQPAVGLTGDKTLVLFDTETPAEATMVEVSGVDMLLGIDFRPADRKLYGVTADGSVVSIDVASGAATVVSSLSASLSDGVQASVDFNPMADRLRIMGSDGTNLRAHPDTGEVTTDGSLAFEAGDPNEAMTPEIVATAYTNSYGKPEATAMYDIASNGLFIRQIKPNDGVLNTIAPLGITLGETVAFDVQTAEDGTNTAWLATGGTLYWVDLESGAATMASEGLDTALRDLTVVH